MEDLSHAPVDLGAGPATCQRPLACTKQLGYRVIAMRGFCDHATVPHDWRQIVASAAKLAATDSGFGPMAALACWLADSDYRNAGLCGVMSMCDLIIGPSRAVLANPYLVISYSKSRDIFDLRYEDGSQIPWTREARPAEIRHVLERFLTKRARWYTVRSAG